MSQEHQKSKIIGKINGLVENLGSSSCKMVDLDQFDGKIYKEKICCQQIEGAKFIGLVCPYNDISFNPDINQWMMYCANIWFRETHNIIPSIESGECYHTFPKYINIQRTSKIEGKAGKIQAGRLLGDSAISIQNSKSKPELHKQFYVTIEFQNTSNDDIKNIKCDLDSIKSVLLTDLAKLNNITEFDFCFKFPKILETEQNSLKAKVLNYYVNRQSNWINNTLKPLINDVLENYNLKINLVYL